jgi:hypothetical protein
MRAGIGRAACLESQRVARHAILDAPPPSKLPAEEGASANRREAKTPVNLIA